MTTASPLPDLFKSEATWPLTLRESDIASCEAFLNASASPAPRHVQVSGPSGSGKSFFVRELLARQGSSNHTAIAIYLDAPPADLEASALLERVSPLLSKRRVGNRAAPDSVPADVATRWRKRRSSKNRDVLGYLYRLCRDLIAQIPVVGPFAKALLPTAIPSQAQIASDPIAALRFLVDLSHKSTVIIALDNVQFLPEPVRDLIEIELEQAGAHFRLITIERCSAEPECPMLRDDSRFTRKDIRLGAATLTEIRTMASEALRGSTNLDTLSAAIFRRSAGNLKSAWFQLKLIAEQHRERDGSAGLSYERVIGELGPVDQVVLRLVVFVLGGLTIGQIVQLFKATGLHISPQAVTVAIGDLAALGLLVVNGDRHDRVRVEHELVAQTVHALTPEEEKLEFRAQLVQAISSVLDIRPAGDDSSALYDRLLGIASEHEFREDPALQTHLVTFVSLQSDRERHAYLSTLLRDSVCWSILDLLPGHVVRILLDAVQKSSAFSLGLIATQKLANVPSHRHLAALYEAKYLVQLFRYDEARMALERSAPSAERDAVLFNILLNECEDVEAGLRATALLEKARSHALTEYECVMLRNAGHLFPAAEAREALKLADKGFKWLGLRFGSATAKNNLGIVELCDGKIERARRLFETALAQLNALDSHEVYQPLVNLSATAYRAGDIGLARRYLTRAQEHAPSGLAMDVAMLAFNSAVLSLAAGEPEGASLDFFAELHRQACRTRDLRFVAVVGALAADLEARLRGDSSVDFDTSLLARVRESWLSGIEIYRDVEVAGEMIAAPFVLSPHWRY